MNKFVLLLVWSISFISTAQHQCGNSLHKQPSKQRSLINNQRSDTLDILDYKIYLDITDFDTKIIEGNCRVKFVAKMDGVTGISLDLLQLQIDSVKQGQVHIPFTYNDTLLRANFIAFIDQGEVDSVTVFYRGQPQGDPSGWGGFYFQGSYAYNLGVGFQADPHNYGRVWHPCFDNFVERATYEVTVRTTGTKRAYSNGYITEEINNLPAELIRTWRMDDPIPTYLACVGVSDYVHVNQTYESPQYGTNIPIMLIAQTQDTTNFKNSFIHLKDAMEIYEHRYGPYVWNKIAYVSVPFNAGAMEHATCIMYPQVTLNGTLTYETLMAHELSHHWWGNLVTCRTSADMWINEGLARYSEALFLENLYGKPQYLTEMRKVHRKVLQQAHFDDGEFFPISGVPHSATYGTHSYDKGSTVAHNLRTYMGDEAFFQAFQYIQENFAHKDIDAADFRDALMTSSGQDLTTFFDNWVFNPGFPGIFVDSFTVQPEGTDFRVTTYVRQQLREAPEYFSNVPMEVAFVRPDRTDLTEWITIDGEYTVVEHLLPFHPALVYLNKNDGILQAVTGENALVTTANMTFQNYAYFRLVTSAIGEGDTALVRIQHHRVAPAPFQNGEQYWRYQLSSQRFWTVDGIWNDDFESGAWLFYDGRNIAAGNLDRDFIDVQGAAFTEDSLVLMWRPDRASDWQVYPYYTQNKQGSATDGSGRFVLDQLWKGEYTFAYAFSSVAIDELSKEEGTFTIFPNPGSDKVRIVGADLLNEHTEIMVYDASGKLVFSGTPDEQGEFSVQHFAEGTHFVQLFAKGKSLGTVKFVKHK
jgi:hypothetical protein